MADIVHHDLTFICIINLIDSQRHVSIGGSVEDRPSRNGSFSSVTSAPGPIVFPEEKPEGQGMSQNLMGLNQYTCKSLQGMSQNLKWISIYMYMSIMLFCLRILW